MLGLATLILCQNDSWWWIDGNFPQLTARTGRTGQFRRH